MNLSQLQFFFTKPAGDTADESTELDLDSKTVPLRFRSNPRAHRYLLYILADGSVRVTIPRRGSMRQAVQFAREHKEWIKRRLDCLRARPVVPKTWTAGTEVLVEGQPHSLRTEPLATGIRVSFGPESFTYPEDPGNLRPLVEEHLFRRAVRELPGEVERLAARHQLLVRKVTVRNQSSRWGSCSPRGTISLNWRLVQMPPEVRDYIIIHELMHLREMNHSARYWTLVEQACPAYREAEAWIKRNGARLGM